MVTNTIFLPVMIHDPKQGKLYVHVARFPKGQMRLYQHAARLQTVSGAVAEAIRAECPAVSDRVKVIPYHLSSHPPLARTGGTRCAPAARRILYLGRIHPEKGLGLLLARVLDNFWKSDPALSDGWRLRLVGPVDARRGGGGGGFIRRNSTHCVRRSATVWKWVSFVSGDELVRQYRESSVFVYPSVAEKGETFGLAPLEAMALGCANGGFRPGMFPRFPRGRRDGAEF